MTMQQCNYTLLVLVSSKYVTITSHFSGHNTWQQVLNQLTTIGSKTLQEVYNTTILTQAPMCGKNWEGSARPLWASKLLWSRHWVGEAWEGLSSLPRGSLLPPQATKGSGGAPKIHSVGPGNVLATHGSFCGVMKHS